MCRLAAVAVLLGFCAAGADAADTKKRLLLVTHSGGFIHDSVHVAEQVLKEIGPKHGFEVTCYRFTGDPDARVTKRIKQDGKDVEVETTALARYSEEFRKRTGVPVEREHCGRINAETLKNFDVVLFFTTGSHRNKMAPLTDDELRDLIAWVNNGGAFAATHCGSDTLYDTPYGQLVGGFFKTHPPITTVKIRVEDPKHAAAAGFSDGMEFTDEIYIFTDNPYSRDRLHVILSIYQDSFKPKNGARADGDYAVSWCQQVGKGRSFFTSLGHRKEVWQDERFQQHLVGGMKWALGLASGDATPSAKLASK
jgi:type 1 glutamine amidotransferase